MTHGSAAKRPFYPTIVGYRRTGPIRILPRMWLHRSSILVLASVALLHCSSSSAGSSNSGSSSDGGDCYPDNDGINNVPTPIDLVVDDTGFYAGSPDSGAVDYDAGMKTVITTQNSSTITFTLSNKGTKDHGFEVSCTSVKPAYPNLPAGCSMTACFPSDSTIAPIGPGMSKTVTFVTPVPDNLLYPFKSNAPGDANTPALNGSDGTAWSLM